ncbi:hypothetical protein [Pedobacter sp. CFBP9032]|uniref:hypothetical protein n=1 Tax=Pedobacter sp. CFBP9032 TaxID=3096539 RepID=UPI002A6AC87E|nr:hypothetical protein [Pedobacter sp. CFBP9032]MDY0904070.1 hypothetical protein [Pedobacter sp. CFBP9032]
MHQVTGEYPDYTKHNNRSLFYLDADKSFNPFTWAPPIHWEGLVGAIRVQFTQISNSGSNEIDYDWTGFPENLKNAIPYIVEAIDSAMRTMD